MKEEITEFKQKNNFKQRKPVLSDPDVKKHLEELHWKFVIVTMDKVSNNSAFIRRKYSISKLLAEVSPNKNESSTSTYSLTQKSKEKLLKLTSNAEKKAWP